MPTKIAINQSSQGGGIMHLLIIADTTAPVVPSAPTLIGFAAAAAASFVSNILKGDGMSTRFNAIMAAAAFLIITAVCMILIHGFSGDWRDDAVYFIGLAVVLGGKELIDLVRIAYQFQSPLAPKVEKVEPTVRRASREQN
jgi:hypothetical protein